MQTCALFVVFLCLSFLEYITPTIAAVVVVSEDVHLPVVRDSHDRESVARNSSSALEVRDPNSRFTYYQTGLGACGKYNQPSDFIVALNAPEWNGGSHCFQTITISYAGKSAQAQIVDECEGCPPNALDLSQGLFSYFADTSLGVIYGDWSYNNGSPPPPTSHPTATQSTTTSSSSSLSSASPAVSASAATGTASPVPSSSPHNLETLQIALVELGGIITAGANLRG